MPLERELAFYESIKEQLLQHHEGKYVLIVGDNQLGVFDNPEQAYALGVERVGNIPMLIKQVVKEEPIELIPSMVLGLINAHT